MQSVVTHPTLEYPVPLSQIMGASSDMVGGAKRECGCADARARGLDQLLIHEYTCIIDLQRAKARSTKECLIIRADVVVIMSGVGLLNGQRILQARRRATLADVYYLSL